MNIFAKDFSDEEMARDWTLSDSDLKLISTVIGSYRLYFAVQRALGSSSGKFSGFGFRTIAAHHNLSQFST